MYAPLTLAISLNDETRAIEVEAERLLAVDVRKANRLFTEAARRKLWVINNREGKFIFINTMDQHIRVIFNGKIVLYEKVIIGKDNTPTPQFVSKLTGIVINPVWNIPSDIAVGILRRMQTSGRVWSGYSIHVNGVKVENVNNVKGIFKMSQAPGPRNSLGMYKFNAPNRFGVYIHDTPSKDLFSHTDRKFSAGCIRMQNPSKLAKLLLGGTLPSGMNSLTNHEIKIDHINIHIVSWDIFVNENNELIY